MEGGNPHGAVSFNSLADLETFMKVARTGLTKTLKEGDYDGLVEVMGHLMKVKERQVATDNMFEPLKQTIELLKTYGEEIPEETHVKLQVDSCGPPRGPGQAGGGQPSAGGLGGLSGGGRRGSQSSAGGAIQGRWGEAVQCQDLATRVEAVVTGDKACHMGPAG